LHGLRVAYSADWGYAAVDPEVRRVVAQAVRVFKRDPGCVVEQANPGWEDPFPAFYAIMFAESDLKGMRRLHSLTENCSAFKWAQALACVLALAEPHAQQAIFNSGIGQVRSSRPVAIRIPVVQAYPACGGTAGETRIHQAESG
jgi:hypothetical protein